MEKWIGREDVSLGDEIEAVRRHLDQLVRPPDDELLRRYTILRPRRPTGLYWQLRWLAGCALRWLESKGILRSNPWPVTLKHTKSSRNARPLLIWAVGANPRTLREACDGLSGLLESEPGFAPVLVTDVADFAFFSRLGWLVEYLPRLAGDGEPFEDRKVRFLARLYRGAPVLPVNAGLKSGSQAAEIRRWIVRCS